MTKPKKPSVSAKQGTAAKPVRSTMRKAVAPKAAGMKRKVAAANKPSAQSYTLVPSNAIETLNPAQRKTQNTPAANSASNQSARRHSNIFTRILTWPARALWGQKYLLISLTLVAVSILLVAAEGVRMNTKDARFDVAKTKVADIPHRQVGLVLGAGVQSDRTPTGYLENRLKTAVKLYEAGRVGRLVMSGDNSASHYDEPTVMKEYAVKLGVPAGDIAIDYAGFNTYDSCYRAREVFKLSSVTVITQGYHLPRAVLTCQQLGIDTIGVAAEHKGRDWTVRYLAREHISTAKALVQMYLKPQPTVLGATKAE